MYPKYPRLHGINLDRSPLQNVPVIWSFIKPLSNGDNLTRSLFVYDSLERWVWVNIKSNIQVTTYERPWITNASVMIIQVRFVSYRTWHSDTHFEYIESSPAHYYHFFNSMKLFYSKVMAVEVVACTYIAKKWNVDGTMKWKVYWTFGLTNYVWRSCYAPKFIYWWDNKIVCYNWSDKASNKG